MFHLHQFSKINDFIYEEEEEEERVDQEEEEEEDIAAFV